MLSPDANGCVPTRHWHSLDDGRIQCDVCPRECRLHEGQRGLCFVRARQNDGIVLTTYGRSSGFCVDPIEKKPLNHFLPGTPVLSFGTAGCNLTCKFCQNWDISKSRETDTLADSASPELIARAARELGCRSVAFTYNDPVIFMEYAIDVAIACREAGIRTVAVTAGYMCAEPRVEFYQHMDVENLFGRGVSLDDLTDYNMARALDKLSLRGPHEVFSTLCLRAIYQEQIPLKFLHNDTTSISFYGDYEDDYDGFMITQGYSKDKRPDLNQFLYGLSVTPDKVPVCAEVKSGNTDDKTWNFDFIEKLTNTLKPEVLEEIIYRTFNSPGCKKPVVNLC